MSSVQEPHLHLEVGHILFLDIVGYSKLLADEQKELVQELNQVVRKSEQFRTAEAEGKLTRLPTGDGMVLASNATRCRCSGVTAPTIGRTLSTACRIARV
jgi:hypothetical protein